MRRHSPIALLGLAALAAALALTVPAGGRAPAPVASAASWRGLVGGPRAAVTTGERMIVLLHTPSLAQRLAKARYATESQERTWTSQALAAQQQVLTLLATQGVTVHPDYSYARVVNGFAAILDPRAVALLHRNPDVAGVFSVRAAFPASLSESLLKTTAFGPDSGARPQRGLPGFDGTGVTIALLDGGVDSSLPFLRGHVEHGIDLVGRQGTDPRANPQDPSELERHGTELAGILVGSGGPGGLHGVAPGAQVLPIRVAGWQPATSGDEVVYSRSDQLIAGLDRAVDPNGDGDAHDAARIALVGVAEPYAAFADGAEAQAVQGALDLNTVVVAPAGNDGPAGPLFGSVSGPAGSPAALAVAAADSRTRVPTVRIVLRVGLEVLFDRRVPLLGAAAPSHALNLLPVAPRSSADAGTGEFDLHGDSLAAGKAVVTSVGADPAGTAAAAARAGAAAVVLYGSSLPSGALGVSEDVAVPVVVVPTAAAIELLSAQRAGLDVGVSVGRGHLEKNIALGFVAGFSSAGLAFDGRVKPDLAAPGVGVATSEPGFAADGSPLYGTVSGTSAAAAAVAGAAASLAQMRPSLAGSELKSVLAGYAQRGAAPTSAVGGGTLRIGASAVGEVSADQTTLGFGIWEGRRWHATRTLVVRNVSTRRLDVSARVTSSGESEALHFRVVPKRVVLRPGRAARVQVTVTAAAAVPNADVLTGAVEIAPSGGATLRVPWALGFRRPASQLLARVSLSKKTFAPSDTSPAVLTVQAGNVIVGAHTQVEAVARLDVLLYDSSGRFIGFLARLRDLLPGSYSFGITGRGPSAEILPPGAYELRLAAWPTLPVQAAPTRSKLRFQIE